MTTSVSVCPVDEASLPEVGRFLHENLDGRLSAERWAAAVVPPWPDAEGGHGVYLRDGDRVVGVYLAFLSRRDVGGRTLRVCNLGAWCVLDQYRAHGLRLLRSLLSAGHDLYTDLSPSGSVVPIDLRLGFRQLDTTTDLRPNLPLGPRSARVRLVTGEDAVERLLTGRDAELFRDHRRAAAVRHVVLVVDGRPCYVMYRRVRRKRLPLFAALVHVGEPALFARGVGRLGAHLLRQGVPFLLAERRVAGGPTGLSRTLAGRPKLYRGDGVEPGDVDDLYSEITCVAW